jgi:hypothetical protein
MISPIPVQFYEQPSPDKRIELGQGGRNTNRSDALLEVFAVLHFLFAAFLSQDLSAEKPWFLSS